ncbi:MAG: DUF4132 domain-containing protein [Ruminococcus flavefaciens]|nr:DUF4132 domain-containing protein [Ruminococcus flavefaciens]
MLYSHSTQKFQKLSKALEMYKLESGIIDLALEYLDISKDRNNALLERIPVQQYDEEFGKRYFLADSIKSELRPLKNPELTERYILLSQALYGSESYGFINAYYNFDGLGKHEKEIVKALSSRYGDKAEACYYAICVSMFKESQHLSKDKKSPEICMNAIEFVKDPAVTALLCAFALNQTPVPEKMGIMEKVIFSHLRKDPTTEKAVECIKGLISSGTKFGNKMLMLAVGEGAYFSSELKKYFMANSAGYSVDLAQNALNKLTNPERMLNLIAETPKLVDSAYISCLINYYNLNERGVSEHLEVLAVRYTDEYVNAMNSTHDTDKAKSMEKILIKANPKYTVTENSLRDKARLRISKEVSSWFKNDKEIRKYLMGSLNFADIKNLMDVQNNYPEKSDNNYIKSYGLDDFMKRVITVMTFFNSWNVYYTINNYTGFNVSSSTDDFIGLLIEQGVDSRTILEKLAFFVDNSYIYNMANDFSKAMADKAEDFADTDVSGLPVTARWIYVTALITAGREKYKSQILSLTGDTSKKIKEALVDGISIKWHDEIVELLQSKKSGMREIAVSVLEKNNDGSFTEEITKAFEKEKSGKIKTRLAGLLGMETAVSSDDKSSGKIDIVASLVKGAKGKKVAFLFESPYKTIHFTDGAEVPEDYLKALIILYSDMISIAVNKTAVELAGKINPDELNDFTIEVFRRWADKGATAKTKWVMWFCGVHGGHGMTETLMKYIKEWSEHSRGAIASEAVMAMAVNGSSEALMNVDSIARKFKHKQVRNSANKALNDVAGILGITKEELADKIVPDMNFDDKMCRVFDYGNRQFNVYLTPTLEIEIFNGDKKVKNLPKPAKSDDETKAVKAYEDFKAMKKQIKTVVANQKQRLEYVLMCDRKWTCENWTNLFVKNPVMHCFAIGLIWGVYDGDKLVESFRYMDDGSFTNIDEDEFEIPENAEIGLVHPIELTEEQKKSWSEQLSDYEIVQPFPQIARPCFKPTEQELDSREVTRFELVVTGNYNLRGKLLKLDWSTGDVLDAGWFMEFVRNDVTKCVKNPDGTTSYKGYYTKIEFSGMSIDYMEAEDVTLGKLVFKKYDAGYNTEGLKIKDVNPRYFSEVIMQLSSFGNAE